MTDEIRKDGDGQDKETGTSSLGAGEPTGAEKMESSGAEVKETSGSEGSDAEPVGFGEAFTKGIKEAVDPFKSLLHTSQALWGIYLSYLIEGLVYFGILTILGKYLSENVGLKDLHAGWVYSFFTGGITLAMLFMGGIADKIGVRKALLLSMGTMVLGRLALAASGTFFPHGLGLSSGMFYMVSLGLFIVVLGYGMYQPAAYAGVKQFTDKKSATIGYAMIYGLMNLGAFFSGLLSPPIRQHFGIVSVFWVYAGLTMLSFLVVALLLTRRAVQAGTLTDIDAEETEDDEADQADGESGANEDAGAHTASKKKEPLWTPVFIGLVALSVAAAGLLGYLGFTAPKLESQKALERASELFKKAIGPVGGAKDAAALAKAVEKTERDLAPLAAKVTPKGPAGARPNPNLYRGIAAWLKIQTRLLQSARAKAGPLTAKEDVSPAAAKAASREVRALGLWQLASAYALVGKVDGAVLDRLRRRMKMRSEKMVPLAESDRKSLLSVLAERRAPNIVAACAARARKAVEHVRVQGPVGAALILEAQASLFETLARRLRTQDDPQLAGLAKTLLLEDSVFLLKELGPSLASRKGKADGGKSLLASYLASASRRAAGLVDQAGAAQNMPRMEAVMHWLRRFGLVTILLILFVTFTLIYMLKRRPDHPFRDSRFVFFIFILIPVQTLFAHNWLTLPYYINRAFGGSWVGDSFEFFSNINPLLIFFLTPVVAALTMRFRVYKMMVAGTFVMAAPTFLLALGPNPVLLLVYILLMSVGEAMWQPRFLQWVAEIAPKGKAGSYMGIAQFPWFLTKVVTGIYSGYFLARYCPMVGPQNTELLWLIYGIIAMASPLALWMARGWMMKGKNL